MKKQELNIYYSNSSAHISSDRTECISFEQLVRLAKSKEFLKKLNSYSGVSFYCPSFTSFARPFLTAVICRLLTLGKCRWIDNEGKVKKINIITLTHMFGVFIYENLTYKKMLGKINREIDELLMMRHTAEDAFSKKNPLYLRCDLAYGYIAGGSIGHIAGVINHLADCTGMAPIFVSTDVIPTVDENVKTYIVREKVPYGNVKDAASIAFNTTLYPYLEGVLKDKSISFVYQRSALNSYAGVKYALRHNLPFVLEYNGSEVWISNKWGGRKLKASSLSEKIEMLTFEKADLITCVSAPLKDQLIELGIDANKIIVNPNGVNPEMYSPDVDGRDIRKKIGISDSTVLIGFIGTFGPWHGAELLVQAFASLVNDKNLSVPIHLLLVGDGLKMPDVKNVIQLSQIESKCTLTGIVPQVQGPKYLAACDILASPQIKNPDGTPFFGSPTKLFEYMAMGKAIVTSDMDQMAEIFEHEKTALLCEPGDVSMLAAALKTLAENVELRKRLGEAARKDVCEKYTWQIHTSKIVNALKDKLENTNVKNH